VTAPPLQALLCETETSNLWHSRLYYASGATLQHLFSNNSLSCKGNKLNTCEDYYLAKSHRLPFSSSLTLASKPVEVIHCDIWGPSPIISNNRYRYYVLFTDQFSKSSWIYFCSRKSEAPSLFSNFKLLV
jgi:GAG-pre-integrase domain